MTNKSLLDPVFTASSRPKDSHLDAVTGAFSYSGRAIAQRLLSSGRKVRTLTGHPMRKGNDSDIEAYSLDFDNPASLVRSLEGVTTLYNTYWVRFAHGSMDHALAIENSRTLFRAAQRAGVQKIVHVSILNPCATSPYPYFQGKALVERALAESGIPYAILRPSVLFDEHGVLLNNIAWLLRRLPVFAVGGNGHYRIRPIHVEDLAALAVQASTWSEDRIVDAVGPERPTLVELVQEIREAVASNARVIRVPSPILIVMAEALGIALHDVLLTPDEYKSMADGLADSEAPSSGSIALSSWLAEHGSSLGTRYTNELNLHFR